MLSLRRRYGPHMRSLLSIGLPLVGSNIAQFAMHMTDSLMLGWYDLTALAAVGIAGSYFFVLLTLGTGFGMAVAPLVAEAAARDDRITGRRATRMALWLVIGFVILVLPLLWFSRAVFLALGQEPQIAEVAQVYLRLAGLSMLPALVAVVLKNFLSSLEHTRVILWSTVGLALLNVPLNWLLIFGHFGLPEMGVRGAAVATLVAASLTVVILVAHILRRLPEYDLFRRFWVQDSEALRTVFLLGLPIGLTSVAEGGLFAASNIMMGWLGEVPLAAHNIALQLSALTFMGHLGLSQALTVRAGQAFGQRNETLLRELTWAAKAVALLWVVTVVSVFLGLPRPMIGAFLDPGDPDRAAVIAMGVPLLAYAALFQLVDAGQVLMAAALRGVQDTRVPMLLAVGSYWLLGLPAAYLCAFALGMGPTGIWVGLVIGLAAACVSLGARFWMRSVRIGPRKTG